MCKRKLIPRKFLLGGLLNSFDNYFSIYLPVKRISTSSISEPSQSELGKLLDDFESKLLLNLNSLTQRYNPVPLNSFEDLIGDDDGGVSEPIQETAQETTWKIPSKQIDIANNPNGYKVTPAQRDLIVLHMIEVGRSRINKSGNPKALHYKWGSKNPNSGAIDCSGFTLYLYNSVGFHIGNGSANQWNSGVNMGTDYHIAQPGDLIINRSTGRKRHVRMVTKNDNGKITVIESAGRVGVREAPLDVHNLVGQVRVIRPLVCDSSYLTLNVPSQTSPQDVVSLPATRSGSKVKIGLGKTYVTSTADKQRIVLNMINEGMRWVGKIPYLWGGKSKNGLMNMKGLDCSGLVSYLFDTQGVNLAVTPYKWDQIGLNLGYNYASAQPGDIAVRLHTNRSGHIRMIIGNDGRELTMLESTSDNVTLPNGKKHRGVIIRKYPLNKKNLLSDLGVVIRCIVGR